VRAWIAAAAILAALQLVSGCAIVTVGEPVGKVAPLSKELKWEGIWLEGPGRVNRGAYVVLVDDADKGGLQICTFEKAKGNERPPLDLHCFGAQVRLVGNNAVLHIAADEFLVDSEPELRKSLKGRWLIVLLQPRGEQVIVLLFEGKEAEKLIAAGKLGGKVIPRSAQADRQVRIDRLEPELLKRWISEDAREFMWKVPIIFDYHPLPE
jgi:hypothetical protein